MTSGGNNFSDFLLRINLPQTDVGAIKSGYNENAFCDIRKKLQTKFGTKDIVSADYFKR